MLNTQIHGTPTALPPLLIAPGLFGSARNWGVIAKRLSDTRQVIALDMRNHGDSFWSDEHSYEAMAADLAEVIEAHGGQADVLGHSMGGKASMQLALTRPELVRKLVVADIAPKGYDHSHSGLIAAMQGLKIDDLTSRSEADRRLSESIKIPAVRAFLLQSLEMRDGPVRWKLNLDVLDRVMADITGWPDTPGRFKGPSLFISGALSDYVTPADHAAIRAQFPAAEFVSLEGAGHWLHAEKPREFEATIENFLTTG